MLPENKRRGQKPRLLIFKPQRPAYSRIAPDGAEEIFIALIL
jgi:hypothetical protein